MESAVHNNSIDTQIDQVEQITSFDIEDKDNQNDSRQKSSFAIASVNLFKSCIGSGVLATPYIFVQGGWLQGIIVVIFITLMIVFTTQLVVEASNKHLNKQNLRLSQIVIILLGHKILYVINSVLMLLQWGACASYFLFFMNFFQYAFYRNDDISIIHQLIYLTIAFGIIFPLLFINDLTYFSKYSLISSISIFTVLTGVIIYSINLISQGQGQFSNQKYQLFSPNNFFLQIGVSMFSIEGMGLIFTIKDSMKDQEKFSLLVNTVYIFVLIQNLTLGLVTSFAFGQNTQQIILLSLPYTWLSQFACIIYSIALVISLVLQLYPCFQMIEKSKIILQFLQKEKKGFIFRRTCTRIMQVLFIALIVLGIPQFALLLSFIGGLSGAILQFLLPMAIYIKCRYHEDNLKIRSITIIICVIGTILGFGAAVSSLKRAIQQDE